MLPDKECEICGVWYTPKTVRSKYCPQCSTHSGWKIRQMNHAIKDSIARNGTGRSFTPQDCTCEYCGKSYVRYIYKQDKRFCSSACKKEYEYANTFCHVCGKPMIETDIRKTMNGNIWLCSPECKETFRWEKARKEGTVRICPNCGKEHITANTYCCRACYSEDLQKQKELRKKRKAAGLKECPVCHKEFPVKEGVGGYCSEKCLKSVQKTEPHALRKCLNCGRTFDCPASLMIEPTCSPECRTQYRKKKKEEAERARIKKMHSVSKAQERIQKKREKGDRRGEFVRKNGLCSICKTPYKDCERMTSDYTASPKGASFEGSLVVRCPKFR